MRIISRWRSPAPTFGIETMGNFAYLSSLKRIFVLDFSEPEQLGLASKLQVDGFPIGLKSYRNRYILAGAGYSGLIVIDAQDPYTAEFIASAPSRDSAISVDVKGRYAFVTDGEAGISIYDISNPSSPRLITTFDTPGFARGIHVVGNRAYVADGPKGLLILDISNINRIENEIRLGRKVLVESEFARYRSPIYEGDVIFDIIVQGNKVLAASRRGLVIYEYSY